GFCYVRLCYSHCFLLYSCFLFLFLIHHASTYIYTLSLHDALPISSGCWWWLATPPRRWPCPPFARSSPSQCSAWSSPGRRRRPGDRKSTRLNSSHQIISYAVFCLKKKKNKTERVTEYKSPNKDTAN